MGVEGGAISRTEDLQGIKVLFNAAAMSTIQVCLEGTDEDIPQEMYRLRVCLEAAAYLPH